MALTIISIAKTPGGSHGNMQTWNTTSPVPKTHAIWPDTLDTTLYYQSKGFVDLVIEDGIVKSYDVNQEALSAYLAENPDPDPVEEAYKAKTAELAKECEAAINNGAEVTLTDGSVHHFSYTLADQANVAEMVNAVSLGASEYTYHADGQAEQVYGKEDIMTIYTTLANHKKQILTYHNLLKEYVGTLDDEAAIKSVKWGDTLPSSYQTRYDELTQTASSQIALMNKI